MSSTFGVEPLRKIVVAGIPFTDRNGLKSLSGLDSIVKLSGSGTTGSITAIISDVAGTLFTFMDNNELYFQPAEVFQSLDGGQNFTLLFSGLVNSPTEWNGRTKEITITVLSKLEDDVIGCIIEDTDVLAGAPEDLLGKPWPMAFGTTEQQPTVPFQVAKDLELGGSSDNRTLGTATVSGTFAAQLTPADVKNWVAAMIQTYLEDSEEEEKSSGESTPEDRVLYTVASTKNETPSGEIVAKANKVQDLSAIIWAEDILSENEGNIYRRTGSKSKKDNLKAAVQRWAKSYLNAKGLDTGTRITTAKSLGATNPTPDNNALFEEIANKEASYSASYSSLLGEVGKLRQFMPRIFISNSDLRATSTLGLDLNINGARVRCLPSGSNYMNFQEILPACTSISVSSPSGDRKNAFKTTSDHNISNMYCRIGNHIVYTTDVDVEYDSQGKYRSATYTYTPTRFKIKSTLTPDLEGTATWSEYTVEAVPSNLTGSVSEASVTWLPRWNPKGSTIEAAPTDFAAAGLEMINQEGHIMTSRTVAYNDQLQPTLSVPPTVDVVNHGGLPVETWQISPGDSITTWQGCPSFEPEEIDAGSSDSVIFGARYYITNCISNTVVHAVFVRSNNRLVQVPSIYYQVHPEFDVKGCCLPTVVSFAVPPSAINSGWGDEIFVTQTSPVGPNTAEEMIWMVENHSSLSVDSSLTDLIPLLEKFPSHFALFDVRNIVEVLGEIAFQARCAVWVEGNTVFARYLAKKGSSPTVIEVDSIEEGGVTMGFTPETGDLVTYFQAKYRLRYTDLDLSGSEVDRHVVVKNNIDKYGTHRKEYDFYIYNNKDTVANATHFWMTRWSRVYKTFEVRTFMSNLGLIPFEHVALSIPGIISGEGELSKVTFSSSDETVVLTIDTNLQADGTINPLYWTS